MSTLTRSQFSEACLALVRKHGSPRHLDCPSLLRSWSWNEHSTFPGLGYLSRSVTVPFSPESAAQLSDEDGGDLVDILHSLDAASAPAEDVHHVVVQLYVVHSATFQVPALYLSAHHDNGAPLSLAEICRLPLFRSPSLFGQQIASFAVQDTAASISLLSQGDHPTLGTPCWYFHPCNTSAVVGEIMAEVEGGKRGDEACALRWLEAWFMFLGNMLRTDF